MEIIGVILAGIVIDLLGEFVAPGDQDNFHSGRRSRMESAEY